MGTRWGINPGDEGPGAGGGDSSLLSFFVWVVCMVLFTAFNLSLVWLAHRYG